MTEESGLARELKKRGPFADSAEETLLSILRTHDRIQLRFDRLFREFGLTSSQYNVLRILRGEGKPLPVLEIASRTIAVVPGITGLIDRLEAAGWVERRRCDQDRRVVYVAITSLGLKRLDDVDPSVKALNQKIVSNLTETDRTTLVGLLGKLRHSAEALDQRD